MQDLASLRENQNNTMDTPLFIFGLVLICIGIFQIGKGISWFKKVFKYTDGLQSWSAALARSMSIMIRQW